MADNVEGTIVLDGLIEGRFNDGDQTVDKLNGWVKFVQDTLGLSFTSDASGDSFSMLPDNRPASASKLAPDPQDAIRQALEQLVQALPENDRAAVFSTLRSSEYRKGEEVQSLYAVQADGTVAFESRTVDAKTVAPVEPLSTKEKVKIGVISFVIMLVFFGALMLIPAVREKVSDVVSGVKAIEPTGLGVHSSQYDKWFTVKIKDASRKVVLLTLTATDDLPTSDAALEQAYKEAETLSEKLAVEALARGYVRIELFNDKGEYYNSTELSLQPLYAKVIAPKKPAPKTDADDKDNKDGKATQDDGKSVDILVAVSSTGKQRIGKLVFRY